MMNGGLKRGRFDRLPPVLALKPLGAAALSKAKGIDGLAAVKYQMCQCSNAPWRTMAKSDFLQRLANSPNPITTSTAKACSKGPNLNGFFLSLSSGILVVVYSSQGWEVQSRADTTVRSTNTRWVALLLGAEEIKETRDETP